MKAIKAAYHIGDRVKLSEAGRENDCYTQFRDRTLIVTAISRNRREHPGFDEAAGSALYDFEDCPCSLYEWEMEEA